MKFRPELTRRKFLATGMALPAIAPAIVHPRQSLAAAAFKKVQAPGYFRFNLGKFEVTVLSDGMNSTPLRFSASNIPETQLKDYLRANQLPTDTRLSHLNVCLINTGDKLVLVDTGAGDNFTETAGNLLASLAAAGYSPEDIDIVMITHGHPDHIWGIFDDFAEEARFPNARYVIDTVEWDYWMAEDLESRMPEGFKFFATGAQRNLGPIADLTARIEVGAEVVPGISTLSARGHTPGHMAVVAQSEGESLLIVGDAITHPFISLEHPEWQPQMDMDKDVAVQTRKNLLDMAAKDRMLMASYHMPFPGVGHVAHTNKTFRWVPLTWRWEL